MVATKGFMSLIVCVLILGLVLEQVQAEGKGCCKNATGRNCYNICFIREWDVFMHRCSETWDTCCLAREIGAAMESCSDECCNKKDAGIASINVVA
jgi:hypothetical protein